MKQPWWRDVDEAAHLVSSLVGAAVGRAAREGAYAPPPGAPEPRRRRTPASLRHLAEVIRAHRLAPGVSVDKDMVAAVLTGDHRQVSDPATVVAVARAAHLIAGTRFDDDDARRLTVACERVADLVERAREADRRVPGLLPAVRLPEGTPPPAAGPVVLEAYFATRGGRRRWPAAGVVAGTAAAAAAVAVAVTVLVLRDRAEPGRRAEPVRELACGADAPDAALIQDSTTVFDDDEATRLSPTLDFDQMNGSARYGRYRGLTYYWGRAGSDDDTPAAGGARVRWRASDGPWHSCPVVLPVGERGYVHTPAVATTILGRPVTVQVCLWRDQPRRENCTPEISTGR